MATLPGLNKGVTKDPTPPATDTVISPITIPNGTILVTTKTTNETIDNVDQIIDYISGDAGPNFIPKSAIVDGGEVFTWTENHNAGEKNLIFGGGEIQFGNGNSVIHQSLLDLHLHVVENGAYEFKIAGSPILSINETEIDLHDRNLVNAPHNHENDPGGGKLELNALTATGTKDSTTFLRGDNTWDIPPATEVFTWTEDHTAGEKNLIFGGGEIQFGNGDSVIHQSVLDLHLHVVENGAYEFKIAGSPILSINETETNLHGKNLNLAGGHIEFGDTENIVFRTGDDMVIGATAEFAIEIAGTTRYTFTDSFLDLLGRTLKLSGGHVEFVSNQVKVSQSGLTDLHLDADIGGNVNLRVSNATRFSVSDFGADGHGFKIINVADPTDPQDVMTKAFADANYGGVGGGIVSINGDTTAAQLITGTTNLIVIAQPVSGTTQIDIGSNVATFTNNLSFFASTTSSQLAGIISDETGTGLLVFGTSPTIITPTIASFINAPHNHEDAIGGGQLNALNSLNATGTPDSTKFLRGDNTWDVPTGVLNDLLDVTITPTTINDILVSDVEGAWINRQGIFSGITGLGIQTKDLVMGVNNDIIMSDSTEIRWVNGNRRIFNDISGFIWEVESGNVINMKFGLNPEYIFSETQADFLGNSLVNVKRIVNKQSTKTFSSSLTFDLDDDASKTISLTGNVTSLTTSNRGAGKKQAIFLSGDGTDRTITFNTSWKTNPDNATFIVSANTVGVLTIYCRGTAETDIVAAYAEFG